MLRVQVGKRVAASCFIYQSDRMVTRGIRYPDHRTGADLSNDVLYLYLKFKHEAGNLRNLQPRWETVYLCVSLKKVNMIPVGPGSFLEVVGLVEASPSSARPHRRLGTRTPGVTE